MTVVGCDRIIVMDRGSVQDIGHPYELLVEKIGDDDITK